MLYYSSIQALSLAIKMCAKLQQALLDAHKRQGGGTSVDPLASLVMGVGNPVRVITTSAAARVRAFGPIPVPQCSGVAHRHCFITTDTDTHLPEGSILLLLRGLRYLGQWCNRGRLCRDRLRLRWVTPRCRGLLLRWHVRGLGDFAPFTGVTIGVVTGVATGVVTGFAAGAVTGTITGAAAGVATDTAARTASGTAALAIGDGETLGLADNSLVGVLC